MSSDDILNAAQTWFADKIAVNHIRNTQKCSDARELTINPFTVGYLANFLEGEANAISIARVLIYPRILGTSIATSFGQNLQSFISSALGAYGSTTSGIDIEFIDKLDGRKKYCQLKAGPQTINFDNISSIHNHFRDIRNLARTNSLNLSDDDLIVGVLYGENYQLNSFYKRLTEEHFHPIHIGSDFWHRLTGEEDFYDRLIKAFRDISVTFDGRDILEDTIEKLSKTDEIQDILKHLSS